MRVDCPVSVVCSRDVRGDFQRAKFDLGSSGMTFVHGMGGVDGGSLPCWYDFVI